MTLEEKILKEFRELYTREIGKYVWFNSDASMSAFKAGDTGKIGKTIEAFISHAIQEAEKEMIEKLKKILADMNKKQTKEKCHCTHSIQPENYQPVMIAPDCPIHGKKLTVDEILKSYFAPKVEPNDKRKVKMGRLMTEVLIHEMGIDKDLEKIKQALLQEIMGVIENERKGKWCKKHKDCWEYDGLEKYYNYAIDEIKARIKELFAP